MLSLNGDVEIPLVVAALLSSNSDIDDKVSLFKSGVVVVVVVVASMVLAICL